MKPPSERNQQLLENVRALVVELIATLPEKAAVVQTKSQPHSTVLEILPTNSRAAPVTIVVPDSAEVEGVTLIAGRGSFFEIPRNGGRYTDFTFLEELKSIIGAVFAGGLEESVTLEGDEVLRGKGTIQLHGEPMTVRWRRLSLRPFRKKDKKHFKYEPYQADQMTASAPSTE
jgi:hypothetical protein